ncbi:MAG: PilZ domain-containing protein [Lachnospiraceae bacterium]|nr:PilZ domain-containing protein [Lachnospiraceae bacterium]
MDDKFYLKDIEEGQEITLSCKLPGQENEIEFKATVMQTSMQYIMLDIPRVDDKRLSFKGVMTSILTERDGGAYVFTPCNIVFYQGNYIAQCVKEGRKINRRKNFRVGISIMGSMLRGTDSPINVYIRDVSASGFSITTERVLGIGEEITVRYTDMGIKLSLTGTIVRKVENQEDGKNIYGCKLLRESEGIAQYVQQKQRDILRKRNR